MAGSLAGPRVVAAVGAPAAMTGGLFGVAAGALALYAIAPGAPALASMAAGFVLMGAGLGVASVAATAAGTATVDGPRQGFASGMLSTSAQLGTVLGLAVMVPVATAWADAHGGGPPAQVGGFELGFTLAAVTAGLTALAVAPRRPPGAGGSTGRHTGQPGRGTRHRSGLPTRVGPTPRL